MPGLFIKSNAALEVSRPKIKLVDAGTYLGAIIGAFPLGLIPSIFDADPGKPHYQGKKVQDTILLTFELDELIEDEGEFKGKRYVVSQDYTFSIYEKANLTKVLAAASPALDLDSIREEVDNGEDFDILPHILHKTMHVTIIHRKSKDGEKTYVNVASCGPKLKSTPDLVIENVDFVEPAFVQKRREKCIEASQIETMPAVSPDSKESEGKVPF